MRVTCSWISFVGNDVVAHAALEHADGDHRRLLRDVHATRDDGLQAQDDLRGDDDGIHAAPRHGRMGLGAAHEDAEIVGGGHERAGAVADLPGLVDRGHVQAEDRIHIRVLQGALFHHHLRAAVLADGRRLLGGLEDELHRAGNALAHPREDFRHAHEDAGVGIVAAGVHHAAAHVVPLGPHGALERDVDFLGDRQRIHVGAQRHHRTRQATPEHAHHARMRHLLAHLDAEGSQVVGDDLRGAHLAVAELGVLVEVAPPGDDLRLDPVGGRGDRSVEGKNGVGSVHG
jgi:hypothetical protein